jgi:three-Cys-motif partner protein
LQTEPLETVAFHIGYTHREFVYADCFSGPWRSGDEEFADTSIRISLDKLNYVRNALARKERHVNVRAIFIEKDQSAFRSLETALQQHRRAVKTSAFFGTFEGSIPAILEQVGNAFAFFFIDPRGWTGFAMNNILPILQHQPGEVMVNFMYDFVNRFINYPDPVNEQSLDEFFGTSDWRQIRNTTDREDASVDLYQTQLRAAGGYAYATSTRILKPLHDRAYFHLIYATRNPKGILEFREVERQMIKEQDRVRSTAQRVNREIKTGQTEIAFEMPQELSSTIQAERARRLEQAKQRLFDLIARQPILYEKIQPVILEIPLVWNTDLNHMLMHLHQAGRITIQGLGPRQRAPRAGNLIRAGHMHGSGTPSASISDDYSRQTRFWPALFGLCPRGNACGASAAGAIGMPAHRWKRNSLIET